MRTSQQYLAALPWLLVWGACLWASCRPNLGPPRESTIACESQADCPDGWRCNLTLGQCLPLDTQDQRAPQVVSSSVTPELVNDGMIVEASLTVSEPLATPPEVSLVTAGETTVMSPTADDANTYQFEVVIDEVTQTEGPAAVEAHLTDTFGNETTATLGGVTLDFTGPTLTNLRWESPPPIIVGTETVGVAAETETGATLVAVRLVDDAGNVVGSLTSFFETVDGGVTQIRGSVPFAAFDLTGVASVAVELEAADALGNTSLAAGAVTSLLPVDIVAPETVIDSSPAGETTAQVATIEFSSSASDVATFWCSRDKVQFTECTSPVVYGDLAPLALGAHTFEVYAVDTAGNVDNTPEQITWTITRRWKEVGAGREHTCAIATDGTLWCWGHNGDGQLGDGTNLDHGTPRQVGSLTDWEQVCGGQSLAAAYNCARRTDRTLWCWGSSGGAIGQQSGVAAMTPLQVGGDSDWLDVSCGDLFACGIREGPSPGSGRLWCWGQNSASQLGQGPDYPGTGAQTPIPVADDQDWQDVDLGATTASARKSDGTLWGWGRNNLGEAGVGNFADEITVPTPVDFPATVDQHTLGQDHGCLVSAGELWCWGSGTHHRTGQQFAIPVMSPARVGSRTDWSHVLAGGDFTCAIDQSKHVSCFGNDQRGQLGDGAPGTERGEPVPIALDVTIRSGDLGSSHGCFVGEDDSLYCVGSNSYGVLGIGDDMNARWQPERVGDATDWRSVGAGIDYTCAQKVTGEMFCFGSNQYSRGYLGTGDAAYRPAPTPVLGGPYDAFSVGSVSTCAIEQGTQELYCWGTIQFSTGFGALVSPTQVGSDGGWTAVSTGNTFACATRETSPSVFATYCFGTNTEGQLGQGTTGTSLDESELVPPTGTHWTAVSCGFEHTCGLTDAGDLYCWGGNSDGELATGGSGGPVTALTEVSPINGWIGIYTGGPQYYGSSCALDDDSGDTRLYCWGANISGKSNPNTTGAVLSPALPDAGLYTDWTFASVGSRHACGLRSGGELLCWGGNIPGTLGHEKAFRKIGFSSFDTWESRGGPVAEPGPWQSVAAGDDHTCAVKLDGTLWCWGDGTEGERGEGLAQSAVPLLVAPPAP